MSGRLLLDQYFRPEEARVQRQRQAYEIPGKESVKSDKIKAPDLSAERLALDYMPSTVCKSWGTFYPSTEDTLKSGLECQCLNRLTKCICKTFFTNEHIY